MMCTVDVCLLLSLATLRPCKINPIITLPLVENPSPQLHQHVTGDHHKLCPHVLFQQISTPPSFLIVPSASLMSPFPQMPENNEKDTVVSTTSAK